MFRKTLTGFLVFGLFLNAKMALAQSSDSGDDRDLDQIEAEIKKNEVIPPPASALPVAPAKESSATVTKETSPPEIKVETLSDLSKLQPFSEISVLQRRYMPKSGRVQFFGGLSDIVNDPWNSNSGFNLRAAYGLTEAWGIEVVDYFMSSTPSQAATNLLAQHNVNAQSFGVTSGFVGGYVMWTPIYGKMSFSTEKIVPFDMYFNFGSGNTSLSGVGVPSSVSGPSVGTGQVFAITRSVGFRWDLTWNMYTLPSGSTNNLLLTFGANWYFPEASYR